VATERGDQGTKEWNNINFVGNAGTVRKFGLHSGSVKFNIQNDEVSTHIFLYIMCNKIHLITVKIYLMQVTLRLRCRCFQHINTKGISNTGAAQKKQYDEMSSCYVTVVIKEEINLLSDSEQWLREWWIAIKARKAPRVSSLRPVGANRHPEQFSSSDANLLGRYRPLSWGDP
jgi:hypothetical protein